VVHVNGHTNPATPDPLSCPFPTNPCTGPPFLPSPPPDSPDSGYPSPPVLYHTPPRTALPLPLASFGPPHTPRTRRRIPLKTPRSPRRHRDPAIAPLFVPFVCPYVLCPSPPLGKAPSLSAVLPSSLSAPLTALRLPMWPMRPLSSAVPNTPHPVLGPGNRPGPLHPLPIVASSSSDPRPWRRSPPFFVCKKKKKKKKPFQITLF
jgi:hypothetical protein